MGEGGEFEREVERVRASGVLGRSGRLRELFDFLAARGPAGVPASQADIAHEVFGQLDAGADDATARVYVHRLRKRLEGFYAREGAETGRLVVPAGSYELVLEHAEDAAVPTRGKSWQRWALPALLLLALAATFVLGRESGSPGGAAEANAIWRPFVESERPIMVAAGDYYIFGEIDPFDPERSRLIRDFAVDSPTDLARAQEADPARYEAAEDMGLSYLPFSSAYALRSLMPVLARHPQPVAVMPASEVTSQTLRDYNVVYVGLVSGMGLLEDVTFRGSGLAVGETYDELVDARSGRRYASGEALSRASTEYYRDFGYLARFREPGGGLVAVVAGARDTGLRGLAPLAAGELDSRLADAAESEGGFEAVFEITGQQGADLSSRLDLARERP
jgi:hypothetical protein